MAYASTPTHGRLYRAEKNNTTVDYTTGWSCDFSVAEADISRQGQVATECLPGQYTVSGTIQCQMVAGNTEQKALFDAMLAGTKLTDMKLLFDASTNGFDLTNGVYILGVSVGANKDGAATWDFSFKASGAVTITDAA